MRDLGIWNYSDDDDDVDNRYQYWGARLLVLSRVVAGPKADTLVWAWMKRRTGKEYFMMITVFGIIVAVIGVVVGPVMQRQEQNEKIVLSSDQS